jgi:hypothetical protein
MATSGNFVAANGEKPMAIDTGGPAWPVVRKRGTYTTLAVQHAQKAAGRAS